MFDWDDNLLYMPTQIYVTTDKGKEIGMGTEDFAHLRSKLKMAALFFKFKNLSFINDFMHA